MNCKLDSLSLSNPRRGNINTERKINPFKQEREIKFNETVDSSSNDMRRIWEAVIKAKEEEFDWRVMLETCTDGRRAEDGSFCSSFKNSLCIVCQ
jgi:hypothetical protein